MRKLLTFAALAILVGAAGFYILTIPRGVADAEMPEGVAARGELVFWAGGCASCHAADNAEGDDKLKMSGGHVLKSPFGDFVAPNISPDTEDGIGSWSAGEFLNAMKAGISPRGSHYYPAFPYASYQRMTNDDVADLWAFMNTLPAVTGKAPDHVLSFPFNIRRGLGLWKLAFMKEGKIADIDAADAQLARGQYLVEGPGHCGECHTPRNIAGGTDYGNWLAGASAPIGNGKIPAIDHAGLSDWSAADIAYYLESGFTPEFDSVGGDMVEVQENMAKLPASDRDAIAAYLKALPAATR